MTTMVKAEKALLVVQDKQIDGNETYTFKEFQHILAYKDCNRQNRFKDETCTYCNKNGHTETVCFSKHDDDKLAKMAEKVSAVMAEKIVASNMQAIESILNRLDKLNLKKTR